MKKFLIAILLFTSIVSKAQITFEFSVDSTLYGYLFYPAKISNTETKYVLLDTVANTFSLYNLDFTPFQLNIPVPSDLNAGSYFYHIMYITRTLFDCDTTNIEYLFSAQNDGGHPFWIQRTDGTTLFYADSTRGPYCLGCPGGTTLLRPILLTENGTKLVLMKDNFSGGKKISVYSLCGTVPDNVYDFTSEETSYVRIFPNPSSMQLNFEITLPDNLEDYEIIILNSNAQEIKREKLKSAHTIFSIDVRSFSSGTYYYTLVSKSKVKQSGKFVLAK